MQSRRPGFTQFAYKLKFVTPSLTKQLFWLLAASVFVLSTPIVNADIVFVDDFEDGNYAGWSLTKSGSDSGGASVAKDSAENSAAWVSHKGAGYHALSKDFTYERGLTLAFDMQATATTGFRSDPGNSYTVHASSGVTITFLTSLNVELGSVSLWYGTDGKGSLGDENWHNYSGKIGEYAMLAGVAPDDPISKFGLSFWASSQKGRYGWSGSSDSESVVGFDNVSVTSDDLDTFLTNSGEYVNAVGNPAGTVLATTINRLGKVIVFIDDENHTRWDAEVLEDHAAGPAPSGMPVVFFDPKEGRFSVAYPSPSGLMIYRREADGYWSQTNLTEKIGVTASPIVKKLTWFISPPPGGDDEIPEATADLISLVGLNPANEVVRYAQRRTGAVVEWTFTNLTTRDLAPRGQPAPGWAGEVVGYVTPWNGQNIAGLNADGEVVLAWSGPDDLWNVTKLVDFAPTPRLAGGLSAYVNWGINLTGILPDGRLGVSWWSKQYEDEQLARGSTQNWAFTILSDAAEGLRPRLRGESVVGLTTPNWVSNNIYGIARDTGHLVVYWWAPDLPWNSTDLNARVPGSDVPTGKLTGVAAKDDSISVFGVNAEGEVLRFFWKPDVWRFENLTKAVTPGS